jgi:hypothetical protein
MVRKDVIVRTGIKPGPVGINEEVKIPAWLMMAPTICYQSDNSRLYTVQSREGLSVPDSTNAPDFASMLRAECHP